MKNIIIDACALSSVFISSNSDHAQFEAILHALYKGQCCMVYGGKKYMDELAEVSSIHSFILALSKMNRVKVLNHNDVDQRQKIVESIIASPTFNDPHLPAIAYVGNCHLICTKDKACMRFVKDKRLYSTHFKVPVFYTSKRHRSLLFK